MPETIKGVTNFGWWPAAASTGSLN
jgi:hypothetical protein